MNLLTKWWSCGYCKRAWGWGLFSLSLLTTAGMTGQGLGYILGLGGAITAVLCGAAIREKFSQRAPKTYNTGSVEEAERIAERYYTPMSNAAREQIFEILTGKKD